MATVSIRSAVVNHKGKIRGNNEDNFYLNGTFMERSRMDEGASIADKCSQPFQVYAVCDGMGGADAGEDASCFVVQELSRRRSLFQHNLKPDQITVVLREISDNIFEDAQRRGIRTGTTIAMVMIEQGFALAVNVGDSRVYRMRDRMLKQLSEDHSKVQRMVNLGMITKEQAKKDPNRHIITQYMGMPSEIRISPGYVTELEIRPGDTYLICSDGLTDMVDDAVIARLLEADPECLDAAKALVKAALENGGRDNVTVMVLKAEEAAWMDNSEKTVQTAAAVSADLPHGSRKKQSSAGTAKSGSKLIRNLLTAGQIVVGSGIIAVVADLIWYFIKTRS